MATVREDVVQISFDVADNPFAEITKDVNAMKTAVTGGVDSSTKKLKNMAGGATQAIGKASVALGKGLVKGAATAAAGIGAAGAAVGGLVTQSVKAYAEYEQLVGGVETLFKDSAPTIQKYANDAYKTAGLSANKYMNTVTSFSASMIASVGGDTAKAAELSNMAITDMSDNANKMGTSMDTVIETYQSLAKGNYAMLDNLKLGYGGTKTEMQRLIKDAAKLDSSVDANSMSYGNMVKALHAVQENMGITGTTAKEASSTISGSWEGVKSTWANLMPALIQGGDSFDQCVKNLVSSAKTFGKNVMPAVKSALSGVGSLVTELAPIIAAELPSMITSVLPSLISGAVTLVNGLVGALPSIIQAVIPPLAEGAMQLVQGLITSIQSNIGLISNVAIQLITSFAQFILQSVPQILLVGMQLLISLVQGIAQQLPTLIPMAIQAIMTLVQGLIGMLPQLITAGIQLIVALVNGLVAALPQLIPAGIQAILALINGIVAAIPQLTQASIDLIPVVVTALIQNLPQIINGGIQLIVALIQGLGQAIPQLMAFMPQIVRTIIDTLKSIDLVSVGKDLIQGLINGIGSMLGAVKDAAANVAKGAANAIKGFLGINSPSRLMIEYGQYTGAGLAKGVQNTQGAVNNAATGLSAAVSEPMQPRVNSYTPSSSSVSNTSNTSTTNTFNPQFTLNMNGASATESNKHKVKQWVKEAMLEMFESMERTNPQLREV